MESPRHQLDERGYVFVKSLLSQDEVQFYRARLQEISHITDADFTLSGGRAPRWCMPDGVNKFPEYWPLIMHDRLLSIVREALGSEARYTRHSDLQVNNDRTQWHRDNVNHEFGVGPDWDEKRTKYQVVRVAIYLQSYEGTRSQLGVIPGSHRHLSGFTKFEFRVWDKINRVLRRHMVLPPMLLSVSPVWFQFEPGDSLIFDARLLHTPTPIRGPKYGIFLSYGADNEHSQNHMRYYLQTRKDLNYGAFPPLLQQELERRNLFLDAILQSSGTSTPS